jgi:hypothetical protein
VGHSEAKVAARSAVARGDFTTNPCFCGVVHAKLLAIVPLRSLAAAGGKCLYQLAMVKQKLLSAKGVALKSRPRKRTKSAPRTGVSPAGGLVYSVHPGVAMVQKWIGELPAKTGRSLEQWFKHIKLAGPATERECRDWLKNTYDLGTNTAWWLAEKAFGGPLRLAEDTPEGYLALAPQYVEQMYSGPKSALRPIYEELVRLGQLLGEDLRICPCKTMVPVYRRHVFAQIRPASQKRVDLGLALGEEPFTSRLRDTGGRTKKDRITHCVALTTLSDVDLQVKRWLKQAYERDGS